MVRRRAFILVCSFVGLVHCKSSDSSDATTSAREDFITSYCQLLAPCCNGTAGATCRNAIGAAVPAQYDETSGTACLDAIRSASGTADFCAKNAPLVGTPACRNLEIRGDVPVGGACNDAVSGHECAGGAPVACVFGQGRSICQRTVLGKAGDACVEDSAPDGSLPVGASLDGAVDDSGTYCDRSKGLHCDFDHTQTCVAVTADGAACTSEHECATTSFCDLAGGSVCKPLLIDGAPCRGDTQCASTSCDASTKACGGALPGQLEILLCGP